MNKLPEIFGSMVFDDRAMSERLPHTTYKALKRTIARGVPLNQEIADTVANAMKDWAIEHGATHFTHWFQPMTGITAEKHDSFIAPSGNGSIIMEFSGKALIRGEPDASSFPSGGLRATFEARGYTAWDPTSYAFIKDGTLCIPTAFCSYSGEALDKKTPLLRSMDAINVQALRILRLFGDNDTRRVITTVGAEQEYFLIDRALYQKRPDLIYCGRTLIGARPSRGQELDDHYFGALKHRVNAFMKELDEELWKLGVLSKTKHNEAAPAQHELAPIFTTTNIATDHNQLTMEMMKKVAAKYDLACLLHEKPFAGVNGSGKHNNWSMSTDRGKNLLEPGTTPSQNAQFLLFLTAVIKAVDEHQDLLRISTATAGNDHRLGANEAPPAIVSMFLGDELTAILDAIRTGSLYEETTRKPLAIGAAVLPSFPRDTTDRNRTSPFAFTGNKFEFRMPGSAQSIAGINFVINTIIADVLMEFADKLEAADNFTDALNALIKETLIEHDRIIFNGNNYSDEWVKEAEKRGLLNLKTTPEALELWTSDKNLELFARHGVLGRNEMFSRQEIMLENYCKLLHIEALTMTDMLRREVIPAIILCEKDIAKTVSLKKSLGVTCTMESDLLSKISELGEHIYTDIEHLDALVDEAEAIESIAEKSDVYCKKVTVAMATLRRYSDEAEMLVGKKYWPYPSYGELLHSVD